MYTSYFGNRKHITNPVAILTKPFRWFKSPCYPKLGPSDKGTFLRDYKSGLINEREYIEQYIKLVLNPLDAEEIYKELIDIYGNDVTLLCYEKPPKFCHRHVVSHWFEKELGVEIEELGFGKNGEQRFSIDDRNQILEGFKND